MNVTKLTGVALAAAAGLFAFAAPVMAASQAEHDVKCFGVNASTGKSSCKSANNACKGQGFVAMSQQACEQVGGEVKK